MLNQAAIDSATRRTIRNAIRKNAATMQTRKDDVDPLLKSFVGGILIRESLTSARVSPQFALRRLRDLNGKGKAVFKSGY